MTFGDVDQQNQQALETLDRQEDERADTVDEPVRYRVTDQEALAIAAQHELQRDYKW